MSPVPRVEVARHATHSQHQEADDGQSDAARDRDPYEHVDVPSLYRAGTIRQMLCGVNPRSTAAVGLPLSQIDSPQQAGNRFANTVPTHSFLSFPSVGCKLYFAW